MPDRLVRPSLFTVLFMLLIAGGLSAPLVRAEDPPPAAVSVAAINAGGEAVSTGGVAWSADAVCSGGKTYENTSIADIAGTTDDVLYLSEYSASANQQPFSCSVPVPEAGTYSVVLHFAEIYWGATGGGALSGGTPGGERVFSVEVEGQTPAALQNVDLNAQVGPMTAWTQTVQVPVNDGALTLDFSASANQAKISAIEVEGEVDLTGPGEVAVQNLDGVPFNDRLAFSRIGSLSNPPSANGVKDEGTVRVQNTGSGLLEITDLTIDGPFELIAPPTSYPIEVLPGSATDIGVRFIAESGGTDNGVHTGGLTITTTDADTPTLDVELAGFWQSVSEGGQEPNFSEIAEVFGYGTDILNPGEQLNNEGRIERVGDEVLSPYWTRLDDGQPVTVRQLAAYHSCCNNTATVYWHSKGSNSTSGIATHNGSWAQTLLPPQQGSTTAPAAGSFSPNGAFGFKVDPEWSDPTKNNTSPDDCSAGPDTCGHHVRFWPAEDRAGNTIPGTFLMTMDYSGINYDFNDNVYLVTNVQPEENTTPTVAQPIDDVAVETDAAPVDVALAGVFQDLETSAGDLNLSVQANTNPGLVTPTLTGSTLNLAFAAGQTGTADLTVRATDGGGAFVDETFSVTVSAPFAGCLSLSTLDCSALPVSTPVTLTWDAQEGGLAGTGFTMAAPPSAPLSTPSNPSVPGYEPSLLSVANGTLSIEATQGIFYLEPSASTETNSQVNALGVGIDATAPRIIETTLTALPTPASSNAQQAGLWFGLGEDNYVKVVAMATSAGAYKVQLGYELNATVPTGNERNTADDIIAAGEDVSLRLVLDPAAETATPFYSVDGGATWIQVEETSGPMSIDPSLFAGTTVEGVGPISYAGVSGTTRRSATPLTFSFDQFSVESPSPALTVSPSTLSLSAPEGGSADTDAITVGTSDGSSASYSFDTASLPGWLNVSSGATGTTNTGVVSLEASAAGLAAGVYTHTLTASATGYDPATLDLTFTVTPPSTSDFDVLVNFQDEATTAPSGTVADYGQAYGVRAAANQGDGQYAYGWIDTQTGDPVSLVGQGRDRSATGQADPLLATTIHMEHPNTPPTGFWEIAVPAEGEYEVTVTVGDASVGEDPEVHRINAEGVNIIDNFEPSGAAGSDSRHTSNSGTVTVTDGVLTLDYTGGGVNTKLNAVRVRQVPTSNDFVAQINFQDELTTPPSGYLADFGEAFGVRSDANQGGGQYSYGWVDTQTGDPVSLVGQGRARGIGGVSLLNNTVIHMEHPVDPPTGFWEIEVPNGTYNVTVGVGDPSVGGDPEIHRVNAEGVTLVDNFEPSGSEGAATRFSSGSGVVSVSDGRLTLDYTGGGVNTKLTNVIVQSTDAAARPSVATVTPANGASNVEPTIPSFFVALDVNLPNGGIEQSSVTSSTVQLYPTGSPTNVVPANITVSGGRDAITYTPTEDLAPFTSYTFELTSGVTDVSGAAFLPFTSSFTTGAAGTGPVTDVEFEKVSLPNTSGDNHSSLVVGPDGKLYATTIDGRIKRWTIEPDGSLSNEEVITSLTDAEGGARLLIGLAFDPASTAAEPIAWVSHTTFGFSGMPDWGGKITRLSGPNLGTVQDYVVNLPRSLRDHVTNSLSIGPDGALYVNQGSNSAMGAPDGAWGNRPERKLTAAVLRIDTDALAQGTLPLDAQTAEGGSYDPFAANAPVTVYASGIRNAYDHVWHSNGFMYVPTNGSAAGGNSPGTPSTLPNACQTRIDDASNGAYTGPSVPEINNVTRQKDWLYRIEPNGYYGHPNPSRCEWVMNGGNPTSSADLAQVDDYPVGVQPDRNYRGTAFDFEYNKSPNGVIEYQSDAFEGALQGKLLVVRYSGGDDIIALTPGSTTGDIVNAETGLPGFTGFSDPLDLIENPATGDIYVSEYGGSGTITLLRPTDRTGGTPAIAANADELVFSTQQGETSAAQSVQITNTGSASLTVQPPSLIGGAPGAFTVSPTAGATLAPSESAVYNITFAPGSQTGVLSAALRIPSDDPAESALDVPVFGLSAEGLGGANEPSLAEVLQAVGHPATVGGPLTNGLPLAGDEVDVEAFEKADGAAQVTLTPLSHYGPESTVNVGWYLEGDAAAQTQAGTLPSTTYQDLLPAGPVTFDPGTDAFGLYVDDTFSGFSHHPVFTEDALNQGNHWARVYPALDRSGTAIPNAFVVAFEDLNGGTSAAATDYNDYVFLMEGVTPADAAPPVADACAPWSLLPCADLAVDAPVGFDWSADEGGLADTDGTGTGFTLVAPPSARLAEDGTPTYADAPGFEPSLLDVDPTSGTLSITTTPGILYSQPSSSSETNSQINGLGVGLDPAWTAPLTLETSVTTPTGLANSGFQQGGLWLGLGEATYVKLVVLHSNDNLHEVQLAVEVNDEPDNTTTGQLDAGASLAGGSTVDLRLVIDPAAQTATGAYSTDGGATWTTVGESGTDALSLPQSIFDGVALETGGTPLTLTGVHATHRRADAPSTYAFGRFDVTGGSSGPVASTYDYVLEDGWSLLAPALDHGGATVGDLFPSAANGSAFGYVPGQGYTTATTLTPGAGYWVNGEAGTASAQGTEINQLSLEVEAGWNLIGGASCAVPRSALGGTATLAATPIYVYGANGGYTSSTELVQGAGHWVNVAGAGTLTLDCANATGLVATATTKTRSPGDAVDGFGRLTIRGPEGRSQVLHYGGTLNSAEARALYLLPPPAPAGFDARFEGGTSLLEGGTGTVQLQGQARPLRVSLDAVPGGETGVQVTVEERANGQVVQTHTLDTGRTLTVTDPAVTALHIVTKELPTTFALRGNYPNPFRQSTAIAFELPQEADVSVEVYNLLGQRVMTLDEPKVQPGQTRTLQVDGSRLNSGVYFYRMTVRMEGDTVVETGRMTLVK